jgi:DNA-binding MarR family transcriptional regulator
MTEKWPPPIDPAAYHGGVGEIVRELAPHTEADPIGVLAVLLSGVGNAMGRGIHARVLGDAHPPRLNMVLVGKTREGAKGSAQGAAEAVLSLALPGWYRGQRASGLSTGEGLIKKIRDERKEVQIIRQGGRKTGQILANEEVVVDAGVADKRLWVVEGEFGRTIKVMGRDSNTLSAILRDAWDGKDLETITSGSPYRASDPHISIIGHITPDELRRYLQATEIANGFANRFLWFLVRRTQYLPDGDTMEQGRLVYWGDVLGGIVQDSCDRFTEPFKRDDEARAKWHAIYKQFNQGLGGMVESILSRPEANILRLSVLYAALDLSPEIRLPHLDAALAVWQYGHNSALCIFGHETGDPILAALQARPLTQTDISNRFGRNISNLQDTLELMEDRGLIHFITEATGGRSRTVWHLGVKPANDEGGRRHDFFFIFRRKTD